MMVILKVCIQNGQDAHCCSKALKLRILVWTLVSIHFRGSGEKEERDNSHKGMSQAPQYRVPPILEFLGSQLLL